MLDEDEDGDRITVRSDEEMKAMLSYVGITNADIFHVYQFVFLLVSKCSRKLRCSQYNIPVLSSQNNIPVLSVGV